ncbi:MAG: molybdopterin-binding protein, partial [Thermoanaerobaculia bacterium]
LVAEILTKLSAEIVFHKVAIRPAKPLLFAVAGKTLVFGLPGNPVSAAVGFDLFVRAAWRQASGLSPALPDRVEAVLTSPAQNRGGRLAFLPARLQPRKGRLEVAAIASKGSHDVAAQAAANAYLVLEPETSRVAGDRVDTYPGTEETTLGW